MSLEHSPSRDDNGVTLVGDNGPPALADDPQFWFAGINEREGAFFLGVTDRTLQKYRQTGGGPRYCSYSSRCLKYRRVDLRAWQEARLRTSTADPGPGTEAA